jgi:probable phosphomutase (TIGR03848 family)
MTRILLLRHAHSVANAKGILAGRTAGIDLSDKGKAQAVDLVERLKSIDFSDIRISPMERCAQTVAPLIQQLPMKTSSKRSIRNDEDLIEVDYGKWTGKKLSVLSKEKSWKIVQNKPSEMYFPGGEGLLAVQARAMRALNSVASTRGALPKLLVSHGDVIKAIVANVLGTHLDHFQKIVIDPASITVLDFNGSDYRVLTLNSTSAPLTDFLAGDSKTARRISTLVGGGSGRSGNK